MKASPELREKMWELCYDLLPEGERSALISQIKSDPHAARLYAEVRLQADLVGYAATVEDSSLNLTASVEKLKISDGAPSIAAPAAGRRKEAAQPALPAASKPGRKSLWAANALAMAAGLALVVLLGVGFFRPNDMTRSVSRLVVTELDLPGQLTPGVTTTVPIRTRSTSQQPVEVAVDVKIVDPAGNVRLHELYETVDGRGQVELSGDAIIPGARLLVEARSNDFVEQPIAQRNEQSASDGIQPMTANFFETRLPVTERELLTHYWIDRPVAAAGEDVGVVGMRLDRFRLEPQAPPTDDVEVNDAETTRRVRPEWRVKGKLAEGVISSQTDEGLERTPKLVEQSKSLDRTRPLRIERAQDFAKQTADRASVELSMQSGVPGGGGGGIAPGQARYREDNPQSGAESPSDPQSLAATTPAPTAPVPAPPAPAPTAGDDAGKEEDKAASASRVAAKEIAPENEVREKELELLKQDGLGAVAAQLETGKKQRQVVDANQPVEVILEADQAGKQLEAIVKSRGIEVNRQKVEPRTERPMKDGQLANLRSKFSIVLPPEVDGDVDVTVVDPAAKSVVLARELYRAPARELRFEALNYKTRYEPGELVQFKLKVTNEHGEPAKGSLAAVRVWNEDFVSDDRAELNMLDDAVHKSYSSSESEEISGSLARFGRQAREIEDAVTLHSAMPGSSPATAGRAPPKALASRDSRSGLADENTKDQLAQADSRESVVEKKAEEFAAGTPPPPAPAGPAGGPEPAGAEGKATDESQTAGATVGRIDAVSPNASTYGFSLPANFFDDQPSWTVSNELAIDRQLQSLKSEHNQSAAAWRAMFGRVLIGGGLVALAILGLLFLTQQQVRWSSGTLALVASAASLVIGAVWITGGRNDALIARAPGHEYTAADAATPGPMEARPMAASTTGVQGIPIDRMQEFAPSGDASGFGVQATELAKEGDGTFEAPALPSVPSATPAFAEEPAQTAAQKPGGEAKVLGEGLETLAPPAKPSASTDPAGKSEPLVADKLPADKSQAEKAESADKPTSDMKVQSDAGALSGKGGGFGGGENRGGQGRGGLDAAAGSGLGGAPDGRPMVASSPPPPKAAERPGETRRANTRFSGAAGQAAPATTSPAAQPPAPETAAADAPAPAIAANSKRDFSEGAEGEKKKGLVAAGAPSAIYFNPQLPIDANGIVTIEFQLPEVASEYRLLLDAYGNGRVGSSAELRIVCKAAE